MKGTLGIWMQAFRPKTLPLALSGIITGFALAIQSGAGNVLLFFLAIFTAIFLQILSNLANDLGDFQKGTDDLQRTDRLLTSGKISEKQMKRAVVSFALLSLICGVIMLLTAFPEVSSSFWILFIVGLLAIAAALNYTMGKKPYGYYGLGDVFVLLFFGFVAVLGSEFLFRGAIDGTHLLPAISVGCMSVAVLNLNNLRDLERDASSGKRTLAVILGRNKAVRYQWFLHSLSVCGWLLFALLVDQWWYSLVLLVFIPIFIHWKNHPDGGMEMFGSERWNALLKSQALGTFMCSLVFLILSLF